MCQSRESDIWSIFLPLEEVQQKWAFHKHRPTDCNKQMWIPQTMREHSCRCMVYHVTSPPKPAKYERSHKLFHFFTNGLDLSQCPNDWVTLFPMATHFFFLFGLGVQRRAEMWGQRKSGEVLRIIKERTDLNKSTLAAPALILPAGTYIFHCNAYYNIIYYNNVYKNWTLLEFMK